MIVVADTSIFLNLCRIERESLLATLYVEVFAPPEVHEEFLRAVQKYPRFAGLIFPPWVRLRAPIQPLSMTVSWAGLDSGERAAIALATELKADLVLIDEAKGRAAARKVGLKVGGVLAVLLDAKALGLIPALAPLLNALEQRARFWLDAETKSVALRLSGELA